MRLGVISQRAVVLTENGAVDVGTASDGRLSHDASRLFERWAELVDWWGDGRAHAPHARPFDPAKLDQPSPTPEQVFAIGLNYKDHASEAGVPPPASPPTFTKFRTSLAAPLGELRLPSASVDWEVELVAVIGAPARNVDAAHAWNHVAGLCVGQDYSDRVVQMAGPMPQFSLGKSYPGFGPFGPWLVTPDEFADPDDLAIECRINGEVMQASRTSQLIFPVAELVSRLSAVCPLLPGDVIFTGTPAGVGGARNPKLFLKPGDEVVSRIEGIGELRQRCIAAE